MYTTETNKSEHEHNLQHLYNKRGVDLFRLLLNKPFRLMFSPGSELYTLLPVGFSINVFSGSQFRQIWVYFMSELKPIEYKRRKNSHTLTTLHVTQADINEDVYLWEKLASKLLHVNVSEMLRNDEGEEHLNHTFRR